MGLAGELRSDSELPYAVPGRAGELVAYSELPYAVPGRAVGPAVLIEPVRLQSQRQSIKAHPRMLNMDLVVPFDGCAGPAMPPGS